MAEKTVSNVFAARTVAFTVAWIAVFVYLIVVLIA